jgi:putative transposase
MARLARLVTPGLPNHVTQRGNRRGTAFFEEDDFRVYRELLANAAQAAGAKVWAYCLMPGSSSACPQHAWRASLTFI